MKKILACFVIFAALIFVVSCGGTEESIDGNIWSSRSSSTWLACQSARGPCADYRHSEL